MKRIIALIFFLPTVGLGQQKKELHPFVEPGAGITTGIFKYVYPDFFTMDAGVVYVLNQNVQLDGSLGYVYFLRKHHKKGISFIPLSASFRYFPMQHIFFEMKAGAAFMIEDSEFYFLSQPAAGYEWRFHHQLKLSYYGFVTNGYVIGGVRASYRYIF